MTSRERARRFFRITAPIALLALSALAAPAPAAPGQRPLQGPVRFRVPLGTPVLAGVSEFDAGGTPIVFARIMGAKGTFGGFIEVGGTHAPLKGRLVCRRGAWSFTAKAAARLDGRKDFTATLSASIDGASVTGKASVREASTGLDLRKAAITGRLAGAFSPASLDMAVEFDFTVDARGRLSDQFLLTGNQVTGNVGVINVATRSVDRVIPDITGADGVLCVRDASATQSPVGHTVLTGIGSAWACDSFFDVFAEVQLGAGGGWVSSSR